MNLENHKAGHIKYDPEQQLSLLKEHCKKIAPEIYRSYALYLQTLRGLLLSSAHNAVLTLITDIEPLTPSNCL